MRTPHAIIAEVERVTRLLLAGQTSGEEGIDAVEPLLAKDEHRLFVVELHRKWIRGQIKAQTKKDNAAGYCERIERARDQWIRQQESDEEATA